MSSSRPSWMDGGVQRPKRPPQVQAPRQSQPSAAAQPAERIVVEVPDGPGTHRNVVIGVTILTFLTLFSVFFWTGIGIAGAVNPPEAEFSVFDGVDVVTVGDYLTFGRISFAAVLGIVGTLATWAVVDNMVD